MFLAAAKRTPVNLEEWAVSMMERHNRKSHLAPQLSPSTQALLRGEPAVSPSKESSASTASKTPTSGDIPIAEEDTRPTLTSDQPPVQRALASDVNGTSIYPSQTVTYERQGFPPRTSSSITQSPRPREADTLSPSMGLPNRPRDSGSFNSSTTLPIRPAPPPSGPLPVPPSTTLRNSTSKRPVPNGSYGITETPQY